MFSFHFQLTEDEYFDYHLEHTYSFPKYRNRIMLQKYLNPALFMAFACYFGFLRGDPIFYLSVFGILSIGWIVFHRKLVERNIRKAIKTIKESGKAPYANDFHAAFEEDKLLTWTDDTKVSTNYSAFEKIVTGKNALYLYVNANSAFILPYRIFASEDEKEALMQLLKQKTNAEVIAGVTK